MTCRCGRVRKEEEYDDYQIFSLSLWEEVFATLKLRRFGLF
jgi:hypothetical protein